MQVMKDGSSNIDNVCISDEGTCKSKYKYNTPLHLWENTKQEPVVVGYFIAGNKNEIKVKHLFIL